MRLLTRFMPGNLVSSTLSTTACLATCILILLSHPVNLVPLFILTVGSLGIHLPVLVMLLLHELSIRGVMGPCPNQDKLRGVHGSGNQLGLTIAHSGIWLAIVGVFIADLVHSLTPPHVLICPSTNCIAYSIAVTLSYIQFFTLVAQLLGFSLLMYELQSAPRRVLADRSLSHILSKSTSQLVSIREEIRRVRALGPEFAQRSPRERESDVYMSETTSTHRRAETGLNMPSLKLEDRIGGRRRTRTTSASTVSASSRLQNHILTLEEVLPVVVDDTIPVRQSGAGVEMAALRSAYRSKKDNGRYPVHQLSDGMSIKSASGSVIDLSDPFANGHQVRLSVTCPSDEGIAMFTRPPSLVLDKARRSFQPAKAESAVIPYSPTVVTTPMTPLTPASPFSPESKYSRWSAEVATPRTVKKVLVQATATPFGTDEPDSPRDEEVVTPV